MEGPYQVKGPLAWKVKGPYQVDGPLSLPVTDREMDRRTEIVIRYASHIEPVLMFTVHKVPDILDGANISFLLFDAGGFF